MDSKLIPITGILMPLVLVPLVMIIRHQQRKREWAHLERMKSLELGIPVSPGTSTGWLAAIGAGVPIVAMTMAFLTTIFILNADPHTLNILDKRGEFPLTIPQLAIVWSCASGVSVMAMVFALILGVIQARVQGKALQSSFGMNLHAKPAFDPVAYEFAGHQG